MFNTFDVRDNTGKNVYKKKNIANKENIDIENQKYINHLHRHSELSHPDTNNIFEANR